MIKKIICLALASALLLGGCASGKLPEASSGNSSAAASSMPSKPSLESAAPRLIVFKASTPAAATTAPSAASPLYFSANDMEQLRSYWPLRQREIGDMGTLSTVSIGLIGNERSYIIMYSFITNISFDDLCKDYQGYIAGNWKINKGAASVYNGKAEGSVDVTCTIVPTDLSSGMISLSFTLSDRQDEVSKLLDAHWPGGLVELPGDFSAPFYENISLNPGTVSYCRVWNVPNSQEAFDQIAESVSGRDGFMHRKLQSSDIDDCITFRDGDVNVQVYMSRKLGKVTIDYMGDSSPFPAPTPVTAQVQPAP